jgi:hypothetical protein
MIKITASAIAVALSSMAASAQTPSPPANVTIAPAVKGGTAAAPTERARESAQGLQAGKDQAASTKPLNTFAAEGHGVVQAKPSATPPTVPAK